MKDRPNDPKDYYVQSGQRVTIAQLAKIYKGVRGCSESRLHRRAAEEGWSKERQEFKRRTAEKTIEKTAEIVAKRSAKNLADLNIQHLEEVNTLKSYFKQLLKQGVIDSQDDHGNLVRKVTLTAKELRSISQSLLDLAHAERLFNNYPAMQPVEFPDQVNEIDALQDPILDALSLSLEDDWNDY